MKIYIAHIVIIPGRDERTMADSRRGRVVDQVKAWKSEFPGRRITFETYAGHERKGEAA